MILLDTHCALWVEMVPERLSGTARARLNAAEKSGEPMAISCISLWEIAYKHARGQLDLGLGCEEFLRELEADFVVLPLNREVVLRAAGFPAEFPRDPMDRLIAGTASAHNLTLITADRKMHDAKACDLLW